jgi:DHHC palmitoyltransferase
MDGRVCRRCVRCFDHHCAFVRNCIGLRNYGVFYLYLWSLVAAAALHAATCTLWLRRVGFDFAVTASAIVVSFFILMGLGLVQYHTQLIASHLTTNEHQVRPAAQRRWPVF